ncbi:MAG: aspartate/glutamate racemase family protein [Candidatus Competibacterales bacterium]
MTASPPIVVINPNSTEAVTKGIDAAVAPLRLAGGPAIECLTLREGPPGIESQRHADGVVLPLCRLAEGRPDAGAFVIACYSDPGLHLLREATGRPVYGIAESAMATALTCGERFGVISILAQSIPRHLRQVRAMGLTARFANDRAIGLGVLGLGDDAEALARMIETGQQLRDADGADVVIMGCAGMARFQKPLAEALGIAVIEPTQVAVVMALGAVQLRGAMGGG